MKFEDFLMERSEKHKKKIELQEEVDKLQVKLDGEKQVNRFLRRALEGPASLLSLQRSPLLPFLLPPQVEALLAELATIEEDTVWLERKIDELKMKLYQEKKLTEECRIQQRRTRLMCGPRGNDDDDLKQRTRSQNYEVYRKGKLKSHRRSSMGSSTDILSLSSSQCTSNLSLYF